MSLLACWICVFCSGGLPEDETLVPKPVEVNTFMYYMI